MFFFIQQGKCRHVEKLMYLKLLINVSVICLSIYLNEKFIAKFKKIFTMGYVNLEIINMMRSKYINNF